MSTATAKVSDQRYSVLPYLEKRFDRSKRSHGFVARDRAGWRDWRRRTVKRLKAITGFDTMQTCPLRPRITETVACAGYDRQRIEIQTEPGVIATLYALVPHGLKSKERRPAVLCPHGHASGGKYSPAGRRDIPEIARQIEHYNYDYGVQYAKAGLVAFCPDARGFGERQEPSIHLGAQQPITVSSCQMINQMAYPLGQTVTGMWAWDLCRLIDYIETRSDCDAERIGCAGLSGGGLQTLWASAFDERIKAAVISGYFYGYKQSLLRMHWNCSCNYVPHLYETADIGDVAALIAPRPLLVETGTLDPLNGPSGLKNVTSQLAITRRAYRVLGAASNLVHDVFEGEHRWHGKLALPWLKQQFEGDLT